MQTDSDWKAFKDMIGSSISPRHPDDIALDQYYQAMDSSDGLFDNPNVPGEFDYQLYIQAQQKFLSQLPQSTVDYINSRRYKYDSPMRVAYLQDMAKTQPYYDIRSSILSQYDPSITYIINAALASPDYSIQSAILSGNPTATIVQRRIRLLQTQYRLKNPDIDQILRYWER
jgi:hypothetical protein